ncbi:MAG: ATP-binding protein [Eubacterium sp.]|nr:ATP-binding protein [Eubacterium sp.]
MYREEIRSALKELRLTAMANEYLRQEELPAYATLAFEDRLYQLVSAQLSAKMQKKEKRLIKAADIRDEVARLALLEYLPERNLDPHLIAEISTMNWIKMGISLLILGATGTGKTYVSSAISFEACRQSYSVKTYRATRLITALDAARFEGTYAAWLESLVKPDVLVLDDFGTMQFNHQLCIDFMEVVEERYRHKKPFIVASQLPVRDWPKAFANPTVADGFMDRVIRNAIRFNLKGSSRREGRTYQEEWADDNNPDDAGAKSNGQKPVDADA